MKYYSELDAGDLRKKFEKEILKWPNVTTKKMFGCPCYQVNGKLFSFLITKGIVITKLTDAEIDELSNKFKIGPFVAGKMTTKKWARIEIEDLNELKKLFPYVKKSFKNAKES